MPNDLKQSFSYQWDDDDQPEIGRPVLSDTLDALVLDDALTHHEAGDALALHWVARLFAHMEVLYGAQFSAIWRDMDRQRMTLHWSAELGRLSTAQLKRGLERLASSENAPTLPQFIRFCKPEIDPRVAYFEAVNGVVAREQGALGEWSDPAVYWAATRIGAFDLKTKPYAQIKSRWEAALAAEQASPHYGPIPQPEIPPSVVDKCTYHRSPSATRKIVAELHATLAQSHKDMPDHKRWARRIQSRIEAGDNSVTELQVQVSREALK